MKKLSKIIDDYGNVTKDTKRFIEKHDIKKTEDANGNDDKLFNASNINAHDRSKGHGYNPGEDSAAYTKEEADLSEKKLTAAEMKKREEVAQAIERDTPDMPMAKKMAIATATAKRVAEEADVESVDDLTEEELVEAYSAVLEALYESLDDETRQVMEEMLESDEGTDQLMSLAEEILQGEETGEKE